MTEDKRMQQICDDWHMEADMQKAYAKDLEKERDELKRLSSERAVLLVKCGAECDELRKHLSKTQAMFDAANRDVLESRAKVAELEKEAEQLTVDVWTAIDFQTGMQDELASLRKIKAAAEAFLAEVKEQHASSLPRCCSGYAVCELVQWEIDLDEILAGRGPT